jgi:hypothetical protein
LFVAPPIASRRRPSAPDVARFPVAWGLAQIPGLPPEKRFTLKLAFLEAMWIDANAISDKKIAHGLQSVG